MFTYDKNPVYIAQIDGKNHDKVGLIVRTARHGAESRSAVAAAPKKSHAIKAVNGKLKVSISNLT